MFKYLHFSQRFPSLSSPPPTREWKEIGVNSELCVGTVRRALSKVNDTLSNELDSLKKEGKVNRGVLSWWSSQLSFKTHSILWSVELGWTI